MKSFPELFKLMLDKPNDAAKLIDKNSYDEASYPRHIGAYFLMGMMRGVLMFCDHSFFKTKLDEMKTYHQEIFNFIKPEDIIGPRRKFGKGSGI